MKCCSGYYNSFSGPWCDNNDSTPAKCIADREAREKLPLDEVEENSADEASN